jgi:hypothetical protein
MGNKGLNACQYTWYKTFVIIQYSAESEDYEYGWKPISWNGIQYFQRGFKYRLTAQISCTVQYVYGEINQAYAL